MSSLSPLSPLDGRYLKQTQKLRDYFSEYAYIKYRVKVENDYVSALCEFLNKPTPEFDVWDFDNNDVAWILNKEQETKHDVKAIEYFVKQSIWNSEVKELVHFGLTSQDVNSVALSLMLNEWLKLEYIPLLKKLVYVLHDIGNSNKDVPMLARTHGQPATPTTLGNQLLVFYNRLCLQLQNIENIKLSAKFGGATGGLNAHYVAYPDKNWIKFANDFVERYGLIKSEHTTQVDHNDRMAELFDNLRRINVILLDMCRDIWQYISMDYFKLKTVDSEVGSSAMPHKVNPIDFENAEGNLGIANALFTHFSEKLPVSRLQRDLSDSTVMRNLGVPIGHTHIAINAILHGIKKLEVNREQLNNDLENNWQVVTEAIQTVLRREGIEQPYEKLKQLTRGKKITKETLKEFIFSMNLSEDVKLELLRITPQNYIGVLS